MVGEAARNGFREVGGVILLIGIPVGLGFGGLMLFIASRLLKQKQKQPPQDDSQNDPH